MKRLACVAALMLAMGMPEASMPSAQASTTAGCSVMLVAGLSGCMEWLMKVSEHRELAARALKGDNDAANQLATFHSMTGEPRAVSRRWWLLAANRGDCSALQSLYDEARSLARGREAARWKARLRQRHCPKPEWER